MDAEKLIEFVREHADEDPVKLLLQKKKYPDVDMTQVAQQMEGVMQASTKWPTLAHCHCFLFPPRLNREQSSSEATAIYKRDTIMQLYSGSSKQLTIADLTGGMGIDSMAFASNKTIQVDYVEQDSALCRLMEHNCKALDITNVDIHCGDSMEWLAGKKQPFNIIFIDPARRDTQGRKVSAFEACTPNIIAHKELLKSSCETLIVKASPMIDIELGASQLGEVSDVHIIEVNGECKEILFICDLRQEQEGYRIHCAEIADGKEKSISYTRSKESQAEAIYCTKTKQYLYEPSPSVMKGGPYKSICEWYKVEKLARNTHLYTSDELNMDFFGRKFMVISEVALNKKSIATAIPDGKAHVVTRNYPVGAAELQRQLGLKEGGELFVIATTVGTKKTGLVCRAV